MKRPLVLIKGGGDVASGIAHGLVAMGVGVAMTELAKPTMVRRDVSFGSAVYEGEVEVEGLLGVLCPSAKEAFMAVHAGKVAVLVDPTCSALGFLRPKVLVDARLAKRNVDTRIHDAPVVIGIGPGFYAGRDCHAVVESQRGGKLGSVILDGSAAPDTGRPAAVMGHSEGRVLRAPAAGVFEASLEIGDAVKEGDRIGSVSPACRGAGKPREIAASISGVLRGVLAGGLTVTAGQKVGDIDPTGFRDRCFSISDKALTIGDGVVEATRRLAPEVIKNAWPISRHELRVQGRGIEYLRRRWPGHVAG